MSANIKIEDANLKVGNICLLKAPFFSMDSRIVLIVELNEEKIKVLILYGSIMWKYAGDTVLLNNNFRNSFTVI